MRRSRRFPSRLAVTLVASAAVLVAAAASALGQSAPSTDASSLTGGGRSGNVAPISSPEAPSEGSRTSSSGSAAPVAVTSSIVSPAWCCTTGSVQGLTVMGQATIEDQGAAARDAAIAAAVKDATDQANAAVDAAGIHLGAMLDLEVSAIPIVYPEGIAASDAGIGAGSPGGTTQIGSAPGATGPDVPPVQYFGSATVTITWAIG